MIADFVETQGRALIAHRLRRLSERFLAGARDWLPQMGVTIPANALSTVLLLAEAGPLAVTDIAQRLRFSHPMIIGLVRDLEAAGAVRTYADHADRRRRLTALTPAGEAQARAIRTANAALARAYDQLGAEVGVDLLVLVEALDRACDQAPFDARLRQAASPIPEEA
jgi:DNA-binding MarR family transcriptional regulator